MMVEGQVSTSGGRKEAIARVRMIPGSGNILVNGRPSDSTFPRVRCRRRSGRRSWSPTPRGGST